MSGNLGRGGRQRALTIVVDVPRQSVSAVRELLSEMATSEARANNLRLPPSTHFARWVLLDQAPVKLAFESNHDGNTREYLRQLVQCSSATLQKLYGLCSKLKSSSELAVYLERHTVKSQAFYMGYPHFSAAEVRAALETRTHVQKYVNAHRSELLSLRADEVHARVRGYIATSGLPVPAPRKVRSAPLRWLTNSLRNIFVPDPRKRVYAAFGLGAFLFLPLSPLLATPLAPVYGGYLLLLLVFAAVVRWRERRDDAIGIEEPRAPHEHVRRLMQDEDHCTQNQITHVVSIKAGFLRRFLLRSVLFGTNLLARTTFNQGELVGIPTIHYARWLIIDDRLVFFSNYDGSWDSYLGDFVDQAAWGLTAVWSHTLGFPSAFFIFGRGARDIERFKAWTRKNQVVTQFWYSAFPQHTVRNIRDALELSMALSKPLHGRAAEAWVARI